MRENVSIPSEFPRGFLRPTIAFDGIRVKIARDLAEETHAVARPGTTYVLRWETLEAHFDRPRKPPLPPASKLELMKLERIRER